MKIEFGAAKDEANQAMHGVSLAAAAEIDLDGAHFTVRGGVIRVIGLRKANRREREKYESP